MKIVSITLPETLVEKARAKAASNGRKLSPHIAILLAKDLGLPLENIIKNKKKAA
jgi:hypothetical protein